MSELLGYSNAGRYMMTNMEQEREISRLQEKLRIAEEALVEARARLENPEYPVITATLFIIDSALAKISRVIP